MRMIRFVGFFLLLVSCLVLSACGSSFHLISQDGELGQMHFEVRTQTCILCEPRAVIPNERVTLRATLKGVNEGLKARVSRPEIFSLLSATTTFECKAELPAEWSYEKRKAMGFTNDWFPEEGETVLKGTLNATNKEDTQYCKGEVITVVQVELGGAKSGDADIEIQKSDGTLFDKIQLSVGSDTTAELWIHGKKVSEQKDSTFTFTLKEGDETSVLVRYKKNSKSDEVFTLSSACSVLLGEGGRLSYTSKSDEELASKGKLYLEPGLKGAPLSITAAKKGKEQILISCPGKTYTVEVTIE